MNTVRAPRAAAPPRHVPGGDNGYFEVLTKAVFQAGMPWRVIDAKWPGFRAAFHGFDIDTVAGYGPGDKSRLLGDAGIIRNERKITATIANARAMRAIVATHASVRSWLRSISRTSWPERKGLVIASFAGVGPVGAVFFLWSVGEATPPLEAEAQWVGPVPPERGLVS